jgi:demethylmenaquinone methyltransferase / 2-methoxy-6-polyprenyl-1,4-benzoquinol methylase
MVSRQEARMADAVEVDFGARRVAQAEKQRLVDDVFRRVAPRYDLMNDLMSGGLHRAWKQVLVTAIDPPKQDRDFQLLDVAGGTGDIAFRVVAAGGAGTHAVVLDPSGPMLEVGRERARRSGLAERVDFIEASAERLPVADKSCDVVSIAFGMRNVTGIGRALDEMCRVLKPLGRLLCLEFSKVEVPVLDALYDLYSFQVIPTLGRVVAGDAEPYRYLVESIRRFPTCEAFAAMIRNAGFRRVSYHTMSGGIVALHSAWRL